MKAYNKAKMKKGTQPNKTTHKFNRFETKEKFVEKLRKLNLDYGYTLFTNKDGDEQMVYMVHHQSTGEFTYDFYGEDCIGNIASMGTLEDCYDDEERKWLKKFFTEHNGQYLELNCWQCAGDWVEYPISNVKVMTDESDVINYLLRK